MVTHTFTLLLVVSSSVVHGREFLGRNDADSKFLSSKIEEALDEMLDSRADDAWHLSIRATLEPIFSVLPKNDLGRLSPAFFRYAVRRYFSQQYGWVIKGFEPHADNTSNPGPDFQSVELV